MPSGTPSRPAIRLARLDDAEQISQVHRSHIDHWYRRIGDERYDVGYDKLSLDERWGFGGQWMSAETCAVHLNNLLICRCYPVVMQLGDRLVAEMELYLHREGPPYGMNCHIGLLYVHRDFVGQGLGRRMVDHAIRFAGERQCDTVTVAARPEHEGFYRKCGFAIGDQMVEMLATVKPYEVEAMPLPRPPNPQSFTWGMDFKIGRYQSTAYHINYLTHPFAVPIYGDLDVRTGFCAIAGRPSMFARIVHGFGDNFTAALAWTAGAGARDLAAGLCDWLYAAGVRSANMQLSKKDYDAIRGEIEGTLIGSRSALIIRLRGMR